MKDIKFKAFDKETKDIYDVLVIDFLNKEVLVIIDETRVNQKNLSFNKCELIQYTGLKDKNNIKIYEEDIISFYIDFGYGNIEVKAEVIYKNSAFILKSNVGIDYLKNFNSIDIRVIGNKYENKDLLNYKEINNEI